MPHRPGMTFTLGKIDEVQHVGGRFRTLVENSRRACAERHRRKLNGWAVRFQIVIEPTFCSWIE